jgi:hypothetical protein
VPWANSACPGAALSSGALFMACTSVCIVLTDCGPVGLTGKVGVLIGSTASDDTKTSSAINTRVDVISLLLGLLICELAMKLVTCGERTRRRSATADKTLDQV